MEPSEILINNLKQWIRENESKKPQSKFRVDFEDLKKVDQIIFFKIKISLKKLRMEISEMSFLLQWCFILNCKKKIQGFQKKMLDFIFKRNLFAVQFYTGKTYAPLSKYKRFPNQRMSTHLPLEDISLFCHIDFYNLIVLNINNHEIKSVQSLSFLNAPKLRCLQLYNNFISNLNTLVKGNFPHLTVITFYHNPITQIEKFYRFHSIKLRKFQFDNNITHKNKVEDYRFLFKMQSSLPKMIKIQDKNRVNIKNNQYLKILQQSGTNIFSIN